MEEKKKNSTEETENHINDSADGKIDKLDSLLLDSEDDDVNKSSDSDSAKFEAFMAEYRHLMHSSLGTEEEEKTDEKEVEEIDESEFLISLPKKSEKKKKPSTEVKSENREDDGVWDEAITLQPEEYEETDVADKIMVEELPEEEPEPDFDLGEPIQENDDDFQISINFDGEESEEINEEPVKERKYDPENPRAIDWIFELAEMFVFVLIAVMVITSFFFKHSIVEGDSMLNTLEDGDHLIISDLFYTPERGDIIVFEDYSTDLKKAVVKRIIALPGETVEVKLNLAGEYEVYINGEFLEENYAYNDIDYSAPGVGTWTVGEGEVFVMGDNRYNSTDSRDGRVGTIEIECILGKVLFRFLPFEKFGEVE